MIKDFETVKNQLKELSGIINNFKSEAVQLKIIELIFKGVNVDDVGPNEQDNPIVMPKRQRSKPRNKPGKVDAKDEKKSTPRGRPGQTQVLEKLIKDGFFDKKKLIGDIGEHCRINLAVSYKSTDLSPILTKLVRDQKLRREKNPQTNQYEYIKY